MPTKTIVCYTHRFDWKGERDFGFGFDCDEHGNVDEADLTPQGLANYKACLAGSVDGREVVDRGVKQWEYSIRLCPCGSGLEPQDIYDARGIFVLVACDKCRKEKLSRYRPEIFTDSDYECNEPIDED